MSLREPDNTRIDEPVIDDSGVHAPDPERVPMTLGQMAVTALLVVAILCVFFYGVSEQRTEVAGLTPPEQNIASPAGGAAHETAKPVHPGPTPTRPPVAPASPE